MIPVWVFIVAMIALVLLTIIACSNVIPWMIMRLEVGERGSNGDEHFPWNWRVLMGASSYFDWLDRHQQKNGYPVPLKPDMTALKVYRDALEANRSSAEMWLIDDFLRDMDIWIKENSPRSEP